MAHWAIQIGHYACVGYSPNRLPLAVQNSTLSTPERAVWSIDTIRCRPGDKLAVAFEDVAPTWRHGVWLGVQGELEVGDIRAPQIVLWASSAPPVVELRVLASDDDLVRLYNVWDSGRGILPHESQSATSGMLREELDGAVRYRCSAIADPQFDALTFTVTHKPAP